ncbi:phosphotransferase [Streptomyces sp. MBT65]|uniref:phosphotransferase n=1 Tax=Streptomyces sp. MBT65 TaxID=1488395 RepID=UPI00190980CB|nr:phosphotransferase [Streptomyces sp. MBT65]MBK3576094.1 phosphotransferase [Streptomyces sp. MBT65]
MDTDLPESAILPLIEEHTGSVTAIRRTERGFSSDLTAVVDCAKGPFFVKVMRNRPGGRRESLIRERRINGYLGHISPPLLWDVEAEDWLVLGFELVDGRSADFAPDSTDLALVVDAIGEIGRLYLPQIARDWTETRWDKFASDSSKAELFRGDSLLYTDINPSNFLVVKRRVWAVDWAWPTRGAGFIDPALLVVQLIAAGHTPGSAEKWAERLPAWRGAAPQAIDAFAAANLRMYRASVDRKPDVDWLKAMVGACLAWTEYRGLTPE